MQPQYPAGYGQPQYPPAGYGQPQPQYPVMPQGAPAYPQYPAGPQYAPPAPPAAPPVSGSLDQFYGQPGAGNKAWSFQDKASGAPKPLGTTYVGVVARPITNGDIQQQTDPSSGAPKFFRDGRPMFVMIVPLNVQPSAEFPDGQASWWVRGQARDELVRAMADAGAPEGPPEMGATIAVQLVNTRPTKFGNPSFVYRVHYQRPAGAPPATAPVAQPVAEVPQAPAAPVAPPAPLAQAPGYPPMAMEPQYLPPMPPVGQIPSMVPPVGQGPIPAAPLMAPPTAPAPAAAIPQAAPVAAVAAQLDPQQLALLQQLTGQSAG